MIMGDSSQNGKPAESTTSTNQTQQPDTSEQKAPSPISKQGVFMMRAEGQSWEDFKEAVIKRFREAGMLKG
jgi:hypothetical protein